MLAPYNCRWQNKACLLVDSHCHQCSQPCIGMTQYASVYPVLKAYPLALAEGNHWTESIPIWLDQCCLPSTAEPDSRSWRNAHEQLHWSVADLPFGILHLSVFWHSYSWTLRVWNHPRCWKLKHLTELAKIFHQLLQCPLHLLLWCWSVSQSVPGGHLISVLCSFCPCWYGADGMSWPVQKQ